MSIIEVALRRPSVAGDTAEHGRVASALALQVVVLASSRLCCSTRWVCACS
ncbi:MAG: hypothetical protein ABI249_01955 [Ornithinibacter sp.]